MAKHASSTKREKVLGPSTVARPALFGAGTLVVVQLVLKTFLHV